MVTCCICKLLYNYLCAKLTQSETRAINTNKNLSWTCPKCLPLGADITALKQVVLNLQKEILELKAQKTNVNVVNLEYEEVIQELQEREKRKCNVLIHGVKEVTTRDKEERLSHEQQTVTSIFNELSLTPDVVKITRVGAYDPSRTRSRPIRVVLREEGFVHKILKKKKVLNNSAVFREVNISTDRTRKQIELFKKVKAELERRKNEGEQNLIIKYFRGVPKITTLN